MLKELLNEVSNTCKTIDANASMTKTNRDQIESLLAVFDVIKKQQETDRHNARLSLEELRKQINSLQTDIATQHTGLPRYHYELDPSDPDNSWDQIIREGQAIQEPFYHEGEARWQRELGDSPSGYGWYGTVSMPVITIVATAPEYKFRSTKRLPGRFRLWTPARWGSTLRFLCDRGPTLHDNWTNAAGTPYGFKTDAPIGLYVEPTTDVSFTFRVRPFEQSIENTLLVAHNGTLPIYLADNQDRFWVRDCNIMNHAGATVGIKHGPPIQTDLIKQAPMANVYLADPRFINLQMEGPHSMTRPQAAMFLAGNNVNISGLNLYGWLQGPYLHGGKNRYVQCQVHKSNTHDGRTPLKLDEVCGVTLNKHLSGEIAHCVGAGVAKFLPSAYVAPSTFGTHRKGDGLYGG